MWDNLEKINYRTTSSTSKISRFAQEHTFFEILPAYPLNHQICSLLGRGAKRAALFQRGAGVPGAGVLTSNVTPMLLTRTVPAEAFS